MPLFLPMQLLKELAEQLTFSQLLSSGGAKVPRIGVSLKRKKRWAYRPRDKLIEGRPVLGLCGRSQPLHRKNRSAVVLGQDWLLREWRQRVTEWRRLSSGESRERSTRVQPPRRDSSDATRPYGRGEYLRRAAKKRAAYRINGDATRGKISRKAHQLTPTRIASTQAGHTERRARRDALAFRRSRQKTSDVTHLK
ncbi:unnamed protein product, partial [Iphiclides podalirius]